MKFTLLLFVFSTGLLFDIVSGQALRCSATTWSTWACSVTCGNGTFIRTRTCLNGTDPCGSCWETGNRTIENQTMNCVRDPCPFCSWTEFTSLPCSTSCNTGVRLRTRQCLTATNQPCGTCDGSDVVSEPCTEQPACPDSCGVNSHFERNYTDCGITCQSRSTSAAACTIRSGGCVCNAGYFLDTVAGRCVKECDCGCFDSNDRYHAVNEVWNGTCSTHVCNTGGIIQTIGTICNISFIPTPVNGGWSNWTDPTPIVCPVTCGNGTRPQYRTCTAPTPQSGGLHCSGSGFQLVPCATNITCPGNDTWSAWSNYSGCSATCGNGTRTSYRNCTRATGTSGGDATCIGSSVNVTTCNAGPCPVDGSWTNFTDYSTCSSICSPGLQASRRNCINQTSGGLTCTGYGLQFRNCSGVNDSYQCDAMGFWSNWTALSPCSVSCGVGFQYQTRQCLGAGFGCVGEAINTVICNTSIACPVDGTWTGWSAWSSCPATCGTATIYRTRNCTGAANGGVCLGTALDTQLCDTNVSCLLFPYNATDGNYTAWSSWSACSSTCGSGSRTRTRSCTNPLPRYGGRYCSGSPIEIDTCNASQACPVNGNWTDWGAWSTCSGTCGNGTQSRLRVCGNPSPANGGQQCEGSSVQIQSCPTNMECPVDGVWGNWSLTIPCFGVCGNGTQIYTRNCTPPIAGGMICTGSTRREEVCDLGRPCPVNGGWGNWSNFTTCSATCGVGVYSRIRECNSPTPQNGGDMCVGPPLETAYCLTNVTCPIDGGWTQWTSWSNCSLNCSGGIQTRTRNCSQPAPAFNGLPCLGSSYQYQTCNDDIPCVILITGNPVNGTWGNWSDWTSCAGTCGNGTRTRFRNCSGQYNGGYPCIGPSLQAESCATNVPCPIDGGWSNFTSYGPCSSTCGNGTQVRTRDCNNPIPQNGGAQCVGESRQTTMCPSSRPCPIDGSWSVWAESACSSTCGIGYRVRQRNCSNPAPQFGGAPCIGLALDTILCNISNVSCPIMGQWSSWVTVNNCSATCGTGYTIRNRTCLPAGVDNCVGDSIQIETCDSGLSCATPAPWNSVNGNWSDWSAWSPCSASCGNGTQYQSRVCNNTRASQGGSLCRGDALRIQTCATGVSCPVNGNWTDWSSYSACSTTCGVGIRTQIRYCNNTNNFNQLCIGPALRTETCNENVTCPAAGVWSNWTAWSTCSGSCGTGLQVRTRSCNVTAGGAQCPGSPLEIQQCNTTIPCPIDGGWGNWTDWTNCSSGTCAAGSSYRFRSCDSPQPSNGGQLCPGDAMETRVCYGVATCPVDGNWATWGNWSACSSTCVGGRRFRYRNCSNPSPSNGGLSCIGSSVEVDGTCANSTCGFNPVVPTGTWSSWTAWSSCAATCGMGIMRRVRTCNTSGLPCVGSNFEVAACNSSINCPVDGVWADWGNYSECTASCGVGIQTRTRLCINQADGGQPCSGSATQAIACNTAIPCPIDGQWTTWSSASPCSASCGVGVRVRTRTCSQIVPAFGGVSCPGSSILTETCSAAQNCSVDGQWSSWAPWSACTATCGKNATKYTTRTCSNPAPLYGGAGCVGVGINITNCTELADCPACSTNQVYTTTAPATCPSLCSDPTNTAWCQSSTFPTCLCKSPHAWNAAKNSCSLWCDCGCYGSDNQKRAIGSVWTEDSCRTYQCMVNTSAADAKPQAVVISNNCTDCVYFGWSAWSPCSVQCGQGTQSRNRSCLSLSNPTQTCSTCQGASTQSQICLQPSCEVCELSPYIPSTSCSRTCGGGNQTLTQSCLNVAATNASVPQTCSVATACGSSTPQIGACNTDVCIVCTWSSWVNGRCSVTCGTGIYSRARFCRDQFGGSCLDCAANSDINGTRSCFFPSCTTGRRRRSVFDWLTSWLE